MPKSFDDFKKWWAIASDMVLVRGEETPDLDVQYKIAFSMWKENVPLPGIKDLTSQDGPEKPPEHVTEGPMFTDQDIPF